MTEHFRKLENMYLSAPINRFYAPSLRIERGRAELRMTIRPEFFHAAGAMHGSVYFKAADDTAFFAVNSLVEDVFVLTSTFTIYLLRPISEGVLVAQGTVVHAARTTFVAESVLHDGDGRQIGRGSGTFVRSKKPLSADIGYCL